MVLKHFNKVLNSAMKSANKVRTRYLCEYDLSGMQLGEEKLLLKDIDGNSKALFIERSCKNPIHICIITENRWLQYGE